MAKSSGVVRAIWPICSKVRAGFLDADDVVDGAQLRHRVCRQVARGATRDVVEDVGQRRGRGDGLEVAEHSRLRRLVVVGRHLQEAVDAHVRRRARQVDALAGVVAARASDHARAPVGGIQGFSVERHALGLGQHRRFAGGAGDHDGVVAGADQAVDHAPEGVIVDRPVVVKRRDHRGDEPTKGQHGILPCEAVSRLLRCKLNTHTASPGIVPAALAAACG